MTHGLIDCGTLQFDQELLADVETLNYWALEGRLDVSKVSFHTLGHILDEYALLSAGGALGRGCGPLLIAARDLDAADLADLKIAIPGRYTTAALLLKLFAPQLTQLVEMPFDLIMPSMDRGEIDAGVIIHESRFTYQSYGFSLIQDLGQWWESESGLPIPLGGIVARKSLGRERLEMINDCLGQSVEFASAHPEQSKEYIKNNAQELDEEVIRCHIGLYVNSFSRGLGEEGSVAVQTFLQKGRDAGLLPKHGKLEIVGANPARIK